MVELALKHRGNAKLVAHDLPTKHPESVHVALEAVGRKGLLPIELIPLLPARFAKYTGV